MELALQEAVSTIRSRSDGAELTVKQVHAELVHDAQWASVTLSEVKRASSKVAKASKQANVADLERPMQEMKVRRNFRAPLGWSEPITSREPFSKSPDAAEYAEMRRIIAGFKGAEDGASPEEQSEFVLDAMCTCANDPAPGEPLPFVEVDVVTACLRTIRQEILPPRSSWAPTPLVLWSCARNDFSGDALRVLLRNGGLRHVNEWSPQCPSTPLCIACVRGNVGAVRALVEECKSSGVHLDATKLDAFGSEPLYWASSATFNSIALGSLQDFAEILALLHGVGVDLDCVTCGAHEGLAHTALMRVTELGEKILVRKCLELGVDPSRPCLALGGMTPLHKAVESGCESTVKLLLDAGADTRALLPALDPKSGQPQVQLYPIGYALSSMNMRVADLILREEARRGVSQTPSNPEEERAFLFSNVSTILRCVEDFRRTGNLSGDLGPMFDLRTGPDAEASRAYQAQARARAAAHDAAHPARACAECGVFAVLRSCATCGRVAFCSKTCQRRAWKSWHKAECKALAAGVESNPPAEASALVTMPAEMVNELKASLALHIEELVALNPHPSHGAVTTMVEVHPAVTAILLHELGQATRQRKVTLSPHKLLELLPSLSKTVHPVATGDYGEIIVARGQDPRDAVYVWAGFMSVDVIPPSSSRNLELKIITRAVGEGKPEMHPEGERVFDAYLECATVRALEAWRERKKRETMDRIFEMVTGRMLG